MDSRYSHSLTDRTEDIISPFSELHKLNSVEKLKKCLKNPKIQTKKKILNMLGEFPEESLLRTPVAVKDSGIHPSSLLKPFIINNKDNSNIGRSYFTLRRANYSQGQVTKKIYSEFSNREKRRPCVTLKRNLHSHRY